MTESDRQIAKLLKISQAERKHFRSLSAQKKRQAAEKDLTKLGILTKSGNLAAAFK